MLAAYYIYERLGGVDPGPLPPPPADWRSDLYELVREDGEKSRSDP